MRSWGGDRGPSQRKPCLRLYEFWTNVARNINACSLAKVQKFESNYSALVVQVCKLFTQPKSAPRSKNYLSDIVFHETAVYVKPVTRAKKFLIFFAKESPEAASKVLGRRGGEAFLSGRYI